MEKQQKNGVMTSKTQLPKQTLFIQKLSSQEQKIVLGSLEKKIKDFENEDFKMLHKLLLKWGKFIGLKEAPDDEQMFMLVVFVKENFTQLSLGEITNAFNLAIAGTLNINVEHYNSFSPIYISKIFNAYLEHKKDVMYKMHKLEEEAAQKEKNKPLSEEELEEKNKENAIMVFTNYQSEKTIPDYGYVIYDYLIGKKLISFNKEEKTEILAEAKRMAIKDGERHLESNATPEIKQKIRESILNINQHDSKRSEVVIKYCKNIGLKRYFDSLMVDPEKQAEAMKVFNI
jgi:regulator of sigma D